MQETLHLVLDEVRGGARYRWPAIAAAWAFCLIGWTVVMVLPDVYESSARVFADTRTALSPVIQGLAIEQDINAQLNLVQQSLLGEEQLARVVQETDLVTNAAGHDARVQAMERLRSKIAVSVEPSNEHGGPGSVYWLKYRDSDRDRSLKVVQILLDSFVSDTLRGKVANSAAAQTFLASQIRENESRLREAEQQLAVFKKRNVGTMPGVEGDYFTRLQNEMDAAKTARTALSVAISRRDELSKQLRAGALLAATSGATPVPYPGSSATGPRDTQTQLEEAQAKLDALLRQFTERHPDVGTLRETIAELTRKHESELAALRRGESDTALPSGVTSNPMYQSVRVALNQANVDVAALGKQLSAHESKVAELRGLVNSMPEVEAEFARLNRDYDVTKAQYNALVQRLGQAKLGQDAEASDSGVRLEILNPPTASFRPVAPRRLVLVPLIFLAGIMFGGALAYVLSKLNPVFNHTRELEEITGLPVLGVVSLTWLEKYHEATRRAYVRYSAVTAVLFIAFATLFLIQLRGP